MARRSRGWWVLMWTSAAVCLGLLALMVLSIVYYAELFTSDELVHLVVFPGSLHIRLIFGGYPFTGSSGTGSDWHFYWPGGTLFWKRIHHLMWVPRLVWGPGRNRSYWIVCDLPIWIPTLVAAALFAVAWRHRQAGPRPGTCHGCSYDLTGNVSGICPECGRPIDGAAPAGRGLPSPPASTV